MSETTPPLQSLSLPSRVAPGGSNLGGRGGFEGRIDAEVGAAILAMLSPGEKVQLHQALTKLFRDVPPGDHKEHLYRLTGWIQCVHRLDLIEQAAGVVN